MNVLIRRSILPLIVITLLSPRVVNSQDTPSKSSPDLGAALKDLLNAPAPPSKSGGDLGSVLQSVVNSDDRPGKSLTNDQISEVDNWLSMGSAYLELDQLKSSPKRFEELRGVWMEAANPILDSLELLPPEHRIRLKVIALARRWSTVEGLALDRSVETNYQKQAQDRLAFALPVLRKTRVLRDGLELESVVAILGTSTKSDDKQVEWVFALKNLRGPGNGGLNVRWVREGKAIRWRLLSI